MKVRRGQQQARGHHHHHSDAMHLRITGVSGLPPVLRSRLGAGLLSYGGGGGGSSLVQSMDTKGRALKSPPLEDVLAQCYLQVSRSFWN